MDGLLLVYAVVIALELVLSLVMLAVLLLSVAPRGAAEALDDNAPTGADLVPARPKRATASRVETSSTPTMASHPDHHRFPEDLDRSLRLAFRELSRGSRDVALMAHTRTLLERHKMGGAAGERG